MNPIELFTKWFNEEIKQSKVNVPSAACLSTMGMDDFPNARFVSLKDTVDNCFIVTGPLNSRKGIEIDSNNKVALTFWWTETGRQVRIQGIATKISKQLADKYFSERDSNAQAVSSICKQGKQVEDLKLLERAIKESVSKSTKIARPVDWGGFAIAPIRIEFMTFKKSRFHERKLFEFGNGEWTEKQIQP